MRRLIAVGLVGFGCLALAGIASGQMAISAKSGMINYVEGEALLDGAAVTIRSDSFPQMQKGSQLRTEAGRAEVLLSPGVFMRLGENSAVRLVSDDVMDTRVEFLAGSVIVETADMSKDQALTFTMNGALLGLLNKGLYRLDSEPPQISVYGGEASVTVGGQAQILKRGRRLRLDQVAVAEKFDPKTGDALLWWARRRAEYLAMANVSAAASAQQSAYAYAGTGSWIWNPFFGAYTYLPMWGLYNNFWGWQFYAPSNFYGYSGGPTGPSRPGKPTKGPIHFGPPKPPGHPPVSGGPGGRIAWSGRTAGPNPSAGSGYARGVHSSGGGGYSASGHSGYSGGSHSIGGGYSGGSYSSGGGYSGGGGGHSGGGGGGYSGGGGGYSSGATGHASGGGGGGNASGGRGH